jgi:hypothetical protein
VPPSHLDNHRSSRHAAWRTSALVTQAQPFSLLQTEVTETGSVSATPISRERVATC